eukprot:SAG22_NODE_335_length_12071_cov_5.268771_5_plen_50_part_00
MAGEGRGGGRARPVRFLFFLVRQEESDLLFFFVRLLTQRCTSQILFWAY